MEQFHAFDRNEASWVKGSPVKGEKRVTRTIGGVGYVKLWRLLSSSENIEGSSFKVEIDVLQEYRLNGALKRVSLSQVSELLQVLALFEDVHVSCKSKPMPKEQGLVMGSVSVCSPLVDPNPRHAVLIRSKDNPILDTVICCAVCGSGDVRHADENATCAAGLALMTAAGVVLSAPCLKCKKGLWRAGVQDSLFQCDNQPCSDVQSLASLKQLVLDKAK